ncbi:MAG TPA: M48 family metallopeptidase, partial [Bacteroidales bacterium]|nr:M48 family metallopeptidase [Bacteroidales bacterium]
RWGSCTSRGKITISSELIKLDPAYTDYVIIHELCHLKHHNHGKDFYRLLEELVPDYKALRKELKTHLTV